MAIPVAIGDSFYLERNGCTALIDGGKSVSALPGMFEVATNNRTGIDYLVCTHNDADHANGIFGFLMSRLRTRELWLPSDWLNALSLAATDPCGFVWSLFKSIHNLDLACCESPQRGLPPVGDITLETLGESNPHSASESDIPPESANHATSNIDVIQQLASREKEWAVLFSQLHHTGRLIQLFCEKSSPLHRQKNRLQFSAMKALQRMHAIVIQATRRSIPIRWFEFTPTMSSSGVSDLEPLNAMEVKRPRAGFNSPLELLALSTVNKRSLVFWSPPNPECHPGVLFTADSDLDGFALPRPADLTGAIVTAPHHGSEDNARAYSRLKPALGDENPLIFVRSDGRFPKRPGSSYVTFPARRFCTICRHSRNAFSRKQAIALTSHQGSWFNAPDCVLCSCV